MLKKTQKTVLSTFAVAALLMATLSGCQDEKTAAAPEATPPAPVQPAPQAPEAQAPVPAPEAAPAPSETPKK